MVGAGLLDGLGLGPLDEVRIVEARGQLIALLLGGFGGLREARLFRLEIYEALERKEIRLLANDNVERWIADNMMRLCSVELFGSPNDARNRSG